LKPLNEGHHGKSPDLAGFNPSRLLVAKSVTLHTV